MRDSAIPESISHYQIKLQLGKGGMGEVFLAHDTQLDRDVALKILPSSFSDDKDRLQRFLREARAASALSHSNVAHIYEIGEERGIHFIAMEHVEGETLASRIERVPLQPSEILQIAIQLIDALDEAHDKGITHRDIKPANIMITRRNQVKLLDFGLAKMRKVEEAESASQLATITRTEVGIAVGTVPYMSPEQILAQTVDRRTDYFSAGVVLYQMATGRLPFQGETAMQMMDAILHANPAPVRQFNPNVPADLERIISRMLAKDPADRYQTSKAILNELRDIQSRELTTAVSALPMKSRWLISVFSVLMALAIVVVFWITRQKSEKVRWAKDTALPKISNLIDEEKYIEAFQIATEAERYISGDPALAKLGRRLSEVVSIETDPPGVEIRRKPYKAVDQEWEYLGVSPVKNLRLPLGSFRWKFSKRGYATAFLVTPNTFPPRNIGTLKLTLDEEHKVPQGMVRIPGGTVAPEMWNVAEVPPVRLNDYWLDQYEVTNKQFKEFVDKGGYENPVYWKHEFMKDGRPISREEAMANFRDSTGRPGPLNWQVGDYPDGLDDYPVTGVSWYEAAAYCEYAGKTLPGLYHWIGAAGTDIQSQIVPLSNFSNRELARAGAYQGMSPFGTYDMAGNAKEWC